MSTNSDLEKWFERYKAVMKEASDIAYKKQCDYGWENIGSLGVKGLIPRIVDKVARLKNLIWEKNLDDMKVSEESIEDTATDLANYGLFMVMVMRGSWYPEKMKK